MQSTIRGRVFDEDGRPVAGAAVGLAALSPAVTVPDIGQVTDSEGRYIWTDLDEGRYEVAVRAEGYHLLPRRRTPEEGRRPASTSSSSG